MQAAVLLLGGVFDVRSSRDDTAGAHIDRDMVEGRSGDEAGTAIIIAAAAEVVPAPFGEVDFAAARLVFVHRADEERIAEHELIIDITGHGIIGEIHDQAAHDGVVFEPHAGVKGIDIRHQAIPEPVLGDDSLIGGMALRGDVPRLPERELAVGAIERAEDAPLVPAGLELAPFLEVFGLGAGGVEDALRERIAVLDAEAADVLAPEGDAAERIVEPGGDLRLHVLPARADVTAPRSGGVALEACEAVAGKKEYAGIVVNASLAVVYGLSVHQCVSIEILGG